MLRNVVSVAAKVYAVVRPLMLRYASCLLPFAALRVVVEVVAVDVPTKGALTIFSTFYKKNVRNQKDATALC